MDDEAYWHEGEPRIIASGRWEQDEYGDTTYIPDHVRPSTVERAEAPPNHDDAQRGCYYEDPTPRDGYRIRSEATWAAARRDYLAGDTAEAVCDRYGLKLGTLRSRAPRARAGAAATRGTRIRGLTRMIRSRMRRRTPPIWRRWRLRP